MKKYFFPLILSGFLISLSVWLILYGLDQRSVYYGKIDEAKDNKKLFRLPFVIYDFGLQAWQELDAVRAAMFFRQVVARDPLYMDAWIKLAEAEIATGNRDLARKITVFCDIKTLRVLRWKRHQMLLANDLNIHEIFRHDLNYLIDRKKWIPDIFFLLDTHTRFKTDRALALLSTRNRPAYLKWLIEWNRSDAAKTVWEAIKTDGSETDELLIKYVNYLLSQKDVIPAAALWRQHTQISGMTNGGFEKEITQIGFDWRISNDKDKKRWLCQRAFGQSLSGAHSLRISFFGKENLSWDHVYQVVPVTPEHPYQLAFWWKSKGITTDQGIFVEIDSYDVKGLNLKGPMILGSRDWSNVTVTFTPPIDCHAVVVRLKRNESLRFDCRIQGVLWVDDFALTMQKPEDAKSSLLPMSSDFAAGNLQ